MDGWIWNREKNLSVFLECHIRRWSVVAKVEIHDGTKRAEVSELELAGLI
jgi:hypothetical protein